jgi:glycine cleavage system H lipoate-binding protein
VISMKNCSNTFDCTSCKFDLGMQKKVAKGKTLSWQNAMRKYPPLKRACRHSLTGRIDKRLCAYNFECSKCDFDQYFEEVLSPRNNTAPNEIYQIKGFNMPINYHYHDGHTWAKKEDGGYIRIGIDDFAQKILGAPEALDLPLMGKELTLGKTGWGYKRKDRHADVLSPVDGVIVEVNNKVREHPAMTKQDPFGKGWLFLIRTPDPKKSVKKLMDYKKSLNWLDEEVQELEKLIEKTAGPLAADGGFIGDDLYGNLPGIGWNNLTRTILKTG